MTTAPVLTIALLGILLVLLGANVTRLRALRGPDGEQFPTDPSDELLKAIRAHGNAAEYVPTLAVLVLLVGLLTDGWWATTLMVAAVAFRVVHAVALVVGRSLAQNTVARSVGAAGTYATGIALAVTAIATV